MASRMRARYSPWLGNERSPRTSSTVKKASTRQMILKSELSGETTSMPWKSIACSGSLTMTAAVMASPSAATSEQSASEFGAGAGVAVEGARSATDTVAPTFRRPVTSPVVRTARVVTTRIASGAASLSSSR